MRSSIYNAKGFQVGLSADRQANEFFVRCNRKFRRLTGWKIEIPTGDFESALEGRPRFERSAAEKALSDVPPLCAVLPKYGEWIFRPGKAEWRKKSLGSLWESKPNEAKAQDGKGTVGCSAFV